MFEIANPRRQPSPFEIERWARRERSLFINTLMRNAARKFARWLRVLVLRAARTARSWAAEHLRRRAIRALQQLDDRTLADIGVARSEIESVIRGGRPARAAGKVLRQGRSRRPAQRRVA
jgi:uncharacterized protein YjiS (DUF1127 family)